MPETINYEMSKIIFVIKIFLAFWFCKFAGEIVAEGVVILLHFACGKNAFNGEMFDSQTIMLITYYGYIICIGMVLLYWKLIMKKKPCNIGLNRHFITYFIGAGIGAVLVLISVISIMLIGFIEFNGIFSSANYLLIILLFGGFLIQGAYEEILCRGIVLHSLKENVSLPIAVGVSTLVFIIPHLSGVVEQCSAFAVIGILNLILISIIFSLVTVRFKSLWAACGLHSIWNAVLFCILGLNLSGNDETVNAVFDIKSVGENLWNGGVYGIEESAVTSLVLAFTIIIMLYFKKTKTEK